MHAETELREELADFFDHILDYPCCKRYNEIVKLDIRLKSFYDPSLVDKIMEEYRIDGQLFNG